jgi:hypothetical protein
MRKSVIIFAVVVAGLAVHCSIAIMGVRGLVWLYQNERPRWEKARLARERDYDKHKRVFTPEEFKARVNGKTGAEIKAVLGPPDITSPTTWYYLWRVMNPDTEKADTGRVIFDDDGKARAEFGFKVKGD